MERIRFIDGLRGLSILLVFVDHWQWPEGALISELWLGNIGVEIFFILSGYLIAKVLTRDFLKFYLKRILRIFPVYFAYLLLCFFLADGALREFIFPFTFTSNFGYLLGEVAPRHTQHFWTLAIEEQFYLLSPLIVFIKNEIIYKVLFGICLAFFACELFFIDYTAEAWITYGRILPLIGFFGILNGILVNKDFYRVKNGGYYGLLLVALFALLLLFAPVNKNLLLPVFSIGFSFLFQHLLTHRNFLHILLENTAIVKLGIISYSFYVLHPMVIFYARKVAILDNFLFVFCIAVCASTASYFLIEKPFLLVKQKVSSSK